MCRLFNLTPITTSDLIVFFTGLASLAAVGVALYLSQASNGRKIRIDSAQLLVSLHAGNETKQINLFVKAVNTGRQEMNIETYVINYKLKKKLFRNRYQNLIFLKLGREVRSGEVFEIKLEQHPLTYVIGYLSEFFRDHKCNLELIDSWGKHWKHSLEII